MRASSRRVPACTRRFTVLPERASAAPPSRARDGPTKFAVLQLSSTLWTFDHEFGIHRCSARRTARTVSATCSPSAPSSSKHSTHTAALDQTLPLHNAKRQKDEGPTFTGAGRVLDMLRLGWRTNEHRLRRGSAGCAHLTAGDRCVARRIYGRHAQPACGNSPATWTSACRGRGGARQGPPGG